MQGFLFSSKYIVSLCETVQDEEYSCPSGVVSHRRRFRFRVSLEPEEELACDFQFGLENFVDFFSDMLVNGLNVSVFFCKV